MRIGNKMKRCKKCRRKTEHMLRGFGKPNSIVGNARWSCLECEKIDYDSV